MRVLILCGGYGSRLSAAGGDLPKPMMAVGDKPIVSHIMRGFARWGFREFVLCLGYRSDLFKQYYTVAVDLREERRRTIAAYRAHSLCGQPDTQRAAP